MLNLFELSAYLSSGHSHEESLGISDLDGFLAGIVCSPENVSKNEWLEFALGDIVGVPSEMRRAVLQLFEDTKIRLEDGHPLEPLFVEETDGRGVASDWCEGFMAAVQMRPERWDAFTQTDTGSKLMLPILIHMIDDDGNSVMGVRKEELEETLDAAAQAIPTAIPVIYRRIRMITCN